MSGGGGPVVLVTTAGGAEGARGAAAALACAGAGADRAALMVDLDGARPRPTLLASAAARELEERLVAYLPGAAVAARGRVCHLAAPSEEAGLADVSAALTVGRDGCAVVLAGAADFRAVLGGPLGPRVGAVMVRGDLASERPMLGLLAEELAGQEFRVAVLKSRLAWLAERRAAFGVLDPGRPGGLPDWLVRRLLGAEWGGE